MRGAGLQPDSPNKTHATMATGILGTWFELNSVPCRAYSFGRSAPIAFGFLSNNQHRGRRPALFESGRGGPRWAERLARLGTLAYILAYYNSARPRAA